MKIKELKRTVNVCWSPADHYPVMVAAGSAAQQVDATFSSSSYLELYGLNLEDPGLDLELKSSLQTQHKFQKLVWSGAEIIVGGCDGGELQFYSADRLLNNASDALLGSNTKHNGHVSALDINPYQKNLLASGASESEIFIWDLNNPAQPMAPGTRNQPYDHVQGLAWNHQVQHILGSTFATRCVVWDLRKNEPIMKLSDSQSRTRWRALAWHPAVATQLCIASEDDQGPVVQLWDLRLAASPLVTLEGHQKGVMAVSWCNQDPDLLLSAGKDGRVLCWNPNDTKPGGALLSEISQQQQWVFDVAWCPRAPALLLASSLEQHVGVHALLGGSRPEGNSHNQSNIMDSFGGVDSFSQLPAVTRVQQTVPTQAYQLPTPPKWLKRPASAKFSFGGKLVTFEKCPQEQGSQKLVYISQVVSEPEVVELAAQLDAALGAAPARDPAAADRLAEYCRQRGDASLDQNERYTWFFLRANFLPTFRTEALNLLGFKQDELPANITSNTTVPGDTQPDVTALSRGESTETEAELSTDTSTDLSDARTLIERKLANVDLAPTVTDVVIPNGEDSTSAICRALVSGRLELAVEECLRAGRVADALLVASLGSPDLVYKVQKYHLKQTSEDPVSLVAGSLLQSAWGALVAGAAPSSWRHTLAALLTHCEGRGEGDALARHCEMLGDRLSAESEPALEEAAGVCYLCAMSPDALVARWARPAPRPPAAAPGAPPAAPPAGPAALPELALLARAAAAVRGRHIQPGGKLEAVVNEYASRLAAQGCLQSALMALDGAGQDGHTELRERIMHALGLIQPTQRRPSHQQHQFASRARTASGHSQSRGHFVPHNDINNMYNPPAPQAYEPSSWQQASVPAPQPPFPQRQFAPPHPQALAPQPPQALAPQPPQPPQPLQPPRPGSVGPHSGNLTSRSKYKVDPSVQSAPLYNQYSFNNPAQTPYGGYNSPPPDQYNNTSVPNTFTPINASNPINPLNPVNPLNPINPLNPVNQFNPAVNGGYYNPQQPAVEPAPAPVQKSVPPGWNDPPMLSSKPKPKQEAPATQAPITHPLFGVEPPQHVPLAPVPGQYPGQYTGQQYTDQQYPGQQYPGNQYSEQQYQAQYSPAMTPAYQQQAESPAVAAAAAEPVPKPPVPAEHAALVDVLDALRAACSERATTPQMKRKLEDIQRRLETLYDLLREYRLSESALGSLHACAARARAADYEGALGAAGALAGGADFAAAASFVPALRALLQLAAQLQVRAP